MWTWQSANLVHQSKATELLETLVSGVPTVIDKTFVTKDR